MSLYEKLEISEEMRMTELMFSCDGLVLGSITIMNQCPRVVFSELLFYCFVVSLCITVEETSLHVLPHPSPPVLPVHSISCFIRSYPVFSFDHLENGFLKGFNFVMSTFKKVFDTAFTDGDIKDI
jgi:hypothetical protein